MTEEEQNAWALEVARAMIAASPNPFGRGPEPPDPPEGPSEPEPEPKLD